MIGYGQNGWGSIPSSGRDFSPTISTYPHYLCISPSLQCILEMK